MKQYRFGAQPLMSVLQQQQQSGCCYLCGEPNLGPQHQYNYEHFEPFFCDDDCRTAFHVVMAAPLFDDQGVMLMPLDKLKVAKKIKRRVKQARRAAVRAGRKASRAAKRAANSMGGGGGGGNVVEGSGGRGAVVTNQPDAPTTIVIDAVVKQQQRVPLTANWYGETTNSYACCEGCRQGKHCRDHCSEEEKSATIT